MAFDTQTIVLLAAIGVAVGAVGTLVGAGGGFLLTPALLVLYPHESAQTITSISLAAVFANSASGTIAYLRQRRVDLRSGVAFGAAALPGAIVGALAVDHVPRRAFDAIMAAALAGVAVWLARGAGRRPARLNGVERRVVDRAGRAWVYRVPMGRGIALSVLVGFASSFLGIGGGVFHVPILVTLLGFPTHVATATSHFVLVLMSGGAVITHAVQGSYAFGHGLRRALVLAVSLAAGAQVGARASLRVPALAIERLLAVALALVALRLAVAV